MLDRATLTLLLGATTLLTVKAQDISLDFAREQTGSPVVMVGTSSTKSYLFEKVTVRNVSDKTLDSLTFAVMIHVPSPGRKPERILMKSREIATLVQPGAERTLELFAAPTNRLDSRVRSASGHLFAELGVIAASFENGGFWQFDAEAQGGFGRVLPALLGGYFPHVQCRGEVRTLVASVGYTPVPFFTCSGTMECTLCTNQGQSCNMTNCAIQQGCAIDCAKQRCVYNP